MLIHTNAAKDVIVLPAEIVNTDRNGDFCYVVEDGVVVMRRNRDRNFLPTRWLK